MTNLLFRSVEQKFEIAEWEKQKKERKCDNFEMKIIEILIKWK